MHDYMKVLWPLAAVIFAMIGIGCTADAERDGYIYRPSQEGGMTSTPSANEIPDAKLTPGDGGVYVYTAQQSGEHSMVLVPAGETLIGWDEGRPNERPEHIVYLDSFYIDRFEVTNAQWDHFALATGKPTKDNTAESNHPVVGGSIDDAFDYCGWMGLDVPTEAQWEKAARLPDGDQSQYPWGNYVGPEHANFNMHIGGTTEVGAYPLGVSVYGTFDMAGNVWEWVSDYYAKNYYAASPLENPTGPQTGNVHLIRGGSWNREASNLRVSFRDLCFPEGASDVGFRCVLNDGYDFFGRG